MMWKSSKNKLILLIVLLSLLTVSYLGLVVYNFYSLKKYDEEFLPNTYIGEFDMTSYTFEKANIKLDFYEEYILSKKIKVVVNEKEYEYSYKDLGVSVDIDKTVQEIRDYQKGLSYGEKVLIVNRNIQKVFPYSYQVNDEVLRSTFTSLKESVDTTAVNGFFDVGEKVSYNTGSNGYSLDIEKSMKIVHETFSKEVEDDAVLSLTGDAVEATSNASYATIDTMTSSFVTTFMPNTYLRNINLNTALSYINGSVVEPGEVFSYCDKAGPFDKAGYVFYYEFVGNGVCQIATTTYNAALLGGLEIVKRYPHAKKSAYVAGGLDATVASYSGGWCVDMQFKNTYQYPIYIKAYSDNGQAHVEFWSNHDAKGGYEYQTESVQIGQRGYKSYLHVYKDGAEVEVREIATTWYTEE